MIPKILIVDCEQGSPEWFSTRLGVVTSSNMARVMSTGKGRQTYMRELAAEALIAQPDGDGYESKAMRHGKEFEPLARQRYLLDAPVDSCIVASGFIFHGEDRRSGASGDGIVVDGKSTGILEIKCPQPSTHVGYKLDGVVPKEYHWQVIGELLVPGVEWVDFASYCPALEASGAGWFCTRLTAEQAEKDMKLARGKIDAFVSELDKMIESLKR